MVAGSAPDPAYRRSVKRLFQRYSGDRKWFGRDGIWRPFAGQRQVGQGDLPRRIVNRRNRDRLQRRYTRPSRWHVCVQDYRGRNLLPQGRRQPSGAA
jgi:hypothetical protein